MDAEEVYKHYRSPEPDETVVGELEPLEPAQPRDQDRAVCKNCGKVIVYHITRIDWFWAHLPDDDHPGNLMLCDTYGGSFADTAYAEPKLKEE